MSILRALDNTSSKAANSGKSYAKSTRKYYELKIFQQISLFSSYALKLVILGSMCILGLIFLAISAAFALGSYLDNFALGYLYVAICFFIIMIFTYLGRKGIDKFLIKKLSKTYFDS